MSARVKEASWCSHGLAHLGPHRQQDALPLVVAGPAGVGLAEVAGHDGPVHGRDHLGQGDLLGVAGQHVAAADPALGADQPGALEGEEDLLEVGLGEPGALGDVADRGRRGLRPVQGQRQEGPGRRSRPRVDTFTRRCYRWLRPGVPGPEAPPGGRYAGTMSEPSAAVPATPVLPAFDGPCLTNVVPALLARADADGTPLPDWLPAPVVPGPPGRPARPRRPGVGAARRPDGAWRRPWPAAVGGAHHLGGPEHHGRRPHQPDHRAAPGRPRGGRLPGARRRRGAQRAVVADSGPATPASRCPRAGSSPSRPSPASTAVRTPVVSRSDYAATGFTAAHLAGSRPARLAHRLGAGASRCGGCSSAGERFVYAYYDGIDRVAHARGLGEHYEAELRSADRLVADLLERARRPAPCWWSRPTTARSRWDRRWRCSAPT